MNPEPLRGKKFRYCEDDGLGNIVEEFDVYSHYCVKSAIEFYKRYSFTFNPDNCQDLIQEEQIDVWDKWNEYCSTLKPLPPSVYHYDMWLFSYCFGDVTK